MEQGTINGELIHLVNEYMALRFELPEVQGEVKTDQLHAILAVDRSGSMSGSPIADAKGAAESLANKFRRLDIPLTIYNFNNTFQKYDSTELGYDGLIEEVRKLTGSGGTLFQGVIKSMETFITESNLKNVFNIWLSDGCDNRGLANLEPHMEALKNNLEAKGVSIAVHCIGFSRNHDATLLTKLSQSGTRPGTFQYVPEGGRIPVAVNNTFEKVFESSTWARFLGQAGETSYKVSIYQDVEKSESYKALVYISEEDLEDCKVEIHSGDEVFTYELEPSKAESRNFFDMVHLFTSFSATKIAQCLEKGSVGALGKLREMTPLVQEMHRKLDDLAQEASKQRPFKSRRTVSFFKPTREMIDFFYKVVSKQGEDLDNVTLATLNGMCNVVLLKKNLDDKIYKQVGEVMNELFLADDLVDQVATKFNSEELLKKQENLDFRCAVSKKNWVDSVCEGDCLCITFQVERPQNLVGNPYDLEVVDVHPALISHDTFINSNLFETKAGQIINGQRSYEHGAKVPPADSLEPGMPNVRVNALMPLFITEEHWEISSLRIKNMIAYDITVDVLGYNSQQLLAFPFIVLAKAATQTNNLRHYFNLLVDTCKRIYTENKEEILPELLSVLNNITSLSHRVREKVPRLDAFMGQAYVAFLENDIPDLVSKLPYLFEEGVRRLEKNSTGLHQLSMNYLVENIGPLLEPIREEVNSQTKSYADVFKKLIGESVEAQPQEAKTSAPKSSSFEFTDRVKNLKPEATEALSSITREAEGKLHYLKSLFALLGVEFDSLEALGLQENEQKLCFLIQCFGLSSDNLAASETYFDPFVPEAALSFVQKAYTEAVNREILSYKSNLLSKISSQEFEQKALKFSITEDLDEAAGCLYGLRLGYRHFPVFYKALQTNVPFVLEKVKMLTHGKYKGIDLVLYSNSGSRRWVPKNKNVHKIWQANPGHTQDQWAEAFEGKEEYFEHKYKRLNGEFVPYSKPRKNVNDKRHWSH